MNVLQWCKISFYEQKTPAEDSHTGVTAAGIEELTKLVNWLIDVFLIDLVY